MDSGVSHAVTGIEYEAARAAAFMGYKLICDWEGMPVSRDANSRIPRFTDSRWRGYLSEMTPSLFRSKYEARLARSDAGREFLRDGQFHPDPFTAVRPEIRYRVRNCTRYAVEENQRIQLFVELARGAGGPSEDAWRLMGDLMYQSHYSYTECGLGNEATDLLVDLVRATGRASRFVRREGHGRRGGRHGRHPGAARCGRRFPAKSWTRYAEMRQIEPVRYRRQFDGRRSFRRGRAGRVMTMATAADAPDGRFTKDGCSGTSPCWPWRR